jgi:hypothetical protein
VRTLLVRVNQIQTGRWSDNCFLSSQLTTPSSSNNTFFGRGVCMEWSIDVSVDDVVAR